MITVPDAEEAAKAHNRICRLPRSFFDHDVIHAAKLLPGCIVDGSAGDLCWLR